MNYDQLPSAYHAKQQERIEKLRSTIAEKEMVVAVGNVIPDHGDLRIGTGRFLNAAVLFVDICDFTSRLSNTMAEQEMMLRMLSFFFTEMIRIVEDYGGTVEKNTGDGLMAYFEDEPGEGETGAKRALAATLTMFYASEHDLNPVIARTGLDPIQFRAGLEYGSVTVAQVGRARGYNSIVAIGTPANLASKMLNFGSKNEIVIGKKAAMQLPPGWQQWCHVVERGSGFYYLANGTPYPFYRYVGRWTGPKPERSMLELLAGLPMPTIPPPPKIFGE
ncbi:MAG: adenylate/guanylate cyclase domain-containing protein [Acidobacteria bacterium]|nr:adenylate/guanylate cyclase domain-containing protein [Acidobacteriota bacterium]MBV9067146.1 adenylate/guanylate cyclase domain-containing protein [Acidobacteriota bacterium]MBV9186565.1 adenylate/guanylate cyclase domain-containing protein [Acidobacteriota bacterium]